MVGRVFIALQPAQPLRSFFQGDTSYEHVREGKVLSGEQCCKVSHRLFFAHILGVRVVVDCVFTDPHFYFPCLVFPDHVLGDPNGSVHAHQSSQPLQGQQHPLPAPVLERQHAVSVDEHLPEILLVVVGVSGLVGEEVEVEQSANAWLVVVHPGRKKGGFTGQVFHQDADEVALRLLMGQRVGEDVGVLVQAEPVLEGVRPRLKALRRSLAHQYNTAQHQAIAMTQSPPYPYHPKLPYYIIAREMNKISESTENRLKAAQELLRKGKEKGLQSPNFVKIMVTYRKESFMQSLLHSQKQSSSLLLTQLIANNDVRISEVKRIIKSRLNHQESESIQLFCRRRILNDGSKTIGQLRWEGDNGLIEIQVTKMQVF